jgi:fructokinase
MGLIMSNVYNTTLAFVHLYDDGDRAFSFYRKNCADVMLTYDDINFDLLDNTKAFHFGSLSFTDDPIKSTLKKVLDYCQNKNIILSYDPNYRPTLWDSEENAVESIKIGLSYADILKLSEEEAELLTGEKDPLNACKKLNEYDIKVILVTLGDKGSFYYHKNCYGYVNGRKTKVIDTTGAGDTFFGSAVHQIIKKGIPIEDLKKSDFEEILHFSNIAASLCIENYGGIPAIPKKNEIEKLL